MYKILYIHVENEREFNMGIANFQANIHSMINMKNKMNSELMKIQDSKAAVTAEISLKMKTSEAWYKDNTIKDLQAQDDEFQSQIDQMETKLKAIESNLEAIQKQKSNNIKADVPQLSL